ncbi:hypothetical protein N9H92_05560 [Gammaproteobacteria bacterium]|nr:hypothetical protein [Gammaproteobacteria bacterium]
MNLGRLFWYAQRYSALYFLVFVIYLEFLYLSNQLNFIFFEKNILFKVLATLFILLANIHGFIGLWTVGTDYLTKRTLGFLSDGLGGVANTIRKTYEVFFVAIGFALTISYFYIIWF